MTDMIIVGAGLSGLLTAWRCLDQHPKLRVLIIEASDRIAGDHTWSFNLSDMTPALQDWIIPFIAYQWPRYDVRFPTRRRKMEIPYASGNSDSLRASVQPLIDSGRLTVRLSTQAQSVQADYVILHDGERLDAPIVLDARGFKPSDAVCLGYQKFVGRTYRMKTPHGLENPIIMDATVEQFGGYRFIYCLPFSEHEILVEDTYYTDDAGLSENAVAARIEDYVASQGWVAERIFRQERGVLPITLAVDPARMPDDMGAAPKIGIGGGFYHAVTGYSFPDALRNAVAISESLPDLMSDKARASDSLNSIVDGLRHNHMGRETFLRLLNRMLFRAAEPTERYKVLQRFYGLSEPLIKRFYAGSLTQRDKMRILTGKPPVPISKALYNLSETAFIQRERSRKDET